MRGEKGEATAPVGHTPKKAQKKAGTILVPVIEDSS